MDQFNPSLGGPSLRPEPLPRPPDGGGGRAQPIHTPGFDPGQKFKPDPGQDPRAPPDDENLGKPRDGEDGGLGDNKKSGGGGFNTKILIGGLISFAFIAGIRRLF